MLDWTCEKKSRVGLRRASEADPEKFCNAPKFCQNFAKIAVFAQKVGSASDARLRPTLENFAMRKNLQNFAKQCRVLEKCAFVD